MSVTVTRLDTGRDRLGEGPVWDEREQALYWVDSEAPQIRRWDWQSGAVREWPMHDLIGSLGLRAARGAVIACADGFHAYDFETGRRIPLVDPEFDLPHTRFNDGK